MGIDAGVPVTNLVIDPIETTVGGASIAGNVDGSFTLPAGPEGAAIALTGDVNAYGNIGPLARTASASASLRVFARAPTTTPVAGQGAVMRLKNRMARR